MAQRKFGVRLRFSHGPGCGPACTLIDGHDPLTHEVHGRRALLAEQEMAPSGVVQTGPLAIDYDLNRITVDGIEAPLTPTEAAIVRVLAARPGRTYLHREVVERVWGPATAEHWAQDVAYRRNGAYHGLRVHITRIRARLGAAGALIETRIGHGYRLRIESSEWRAASGVTLRHSQLVTHHSSL